MPISPLTVHICMSMMFQILYTRRVCKVYVQFMVQLCLSFQLQIHSEISMITLLVTFSRYFTGT